MPTYPDSRPAPYLIEQRIVGEAAENCGFITDEVGKL